jgi:N,N'-diacetyllegionaminate synthase
MKTIVVAEAGVNHNGDLELAKNLIRVAAESGADYVKFQMFDAGKLATPSVVKADYQIINTNAAESQFQMLKNLEMSKADYVKLLDFSSQCGIKIFSTGFDIEMNNMLAELGQRIFKVPSGEITNLPYLRNIGQFGVDVILSTGMSNLDEIGAALNALEAAGTPIDAITVLHCTTAYPAPMEDINLLAMRTIANEFDVKVGYSDHSEGIEVSIAAVALGAVVIEKHFTSDRNLPGPDHKASLEPAELKNMIKAIRNIESARGDGVKKLTSSEMSNLSIARKSIVASIDIKEGEIFTDENLTAKRAGVGISPMQWDQVIGKRAQRKYLQNDLIEL